MTITAKPFQIVNISFREDFKSFLNGNKPNPLVAIFLMDQIHLDYFVESHPGNISVKSSPLMNELLF